MDTLSYFDYVLGTRDFGLYAAKWTMAIIALGISLWLHSKKRDPGSNSTPQKFSLGFLLRDNIKRMSVTVGMIFLFLRFPGMLLEHYLPKLSESTEAQLFLAAVIGFSLDKLSEQLKEMNWLGLKKTKVREEILNNKNQNDE